MIQNISGSRERYEDTYRALRLWGEGWYRFEISNHLDDAQECATISYDERDSVFSGWINSQRLQRFVHLRRYEAMRDYGLLS